MSNLEYDTTASPEATNPLSSAARLDRSTEDALYRLFRDFFRVAEEDRRWNLWTDVPWDDALTEPSPELVEAVLDSYREDLFLPDYSARALCILRASRGRAWFLTRWSYEEGKHMLGLNEWLMRTRAFTDVAIRELTEAHLQTFRWEPPYSESFAVLADMLLWELREIDRYSALQQKAVAAGDRALEAVTGFIVRDETAHRDFLRAALATCNPTYAAQISEAIGRVATVQEFPGGESALRALLAIPTE